MGNKGEDAADGADGAADAASADAAATDASSVTEASHDQVRGAITDDPNIGDIFWNILLNLQ